MLRESWKRPSIVVVGWAALLVSVFVLRGDLRIESRQDDAPVARAADPEPVVVRPQRAAREAAPAILRRGRVYDAAGFLAVGADVLVDGRDPVRTDADGRFDVALTPGSSAVVTVRASGHRPLRLRVQEATPEPLAVQLALAAPGDDEPAPLPPLPLVGEGRVRAADGTPLAFATVRALGGDACARTDETGRYELPLANATPTLIAHDADRGLTARSEPLQLDRERGMVPLPDLVAVPGCAVDGTVRDARGAPVAGVPVRLFGQGLERLVETGASGAFRIGGLEPGRYTVRPFAFRGALGMPHDVLLDRPLIDCELSLVAVAERPLRVLDEAGAPVASADVVAEFAGARTSVHRTDAAGWTRVRVRDGALDPAWRFDVRVGAAREAVAVQRYEPEPATLVVALH